MMDEPHRVESHPLQKPTPSAFVSSLVFLCLLIYYCLVETYFLFFFFFF